jgi:uncharacterized cupredoxin-like copper-binding protein
MLRKILLIPLFITLLAACGSKPSAPANDITVEMTDFAYDPASITVPAGEPVTLTLKNMGNIEHDFVVEKIDATTQVIEDSGSDAHHAHGPQQNYDLHVSANAGDTSIIQLTVSEPGSYYIFCSVEGHKEAGMIGELVVLPSQE